VTAVWHGHRSSLTLVKPQLDSPFTPTPKYAWTARNVAHVGRTFEFSGSRRARVILKQPSETRSTANPAVAGLRRRRRFDQLGPETLTIPLSMVARHEFANGLSVVALS